MKGPIKFKENVEEHGVRAASMKLLALWQLVRNLGSQIDQIQFFWELTDTHN